MRRVSANYVYPVNGEPLKNGIIEFSDQGKVLNIIDTKGELRESRNLEFYNGVIIPGFVNTHCHLELSELKNKIEQHKGLPNFVSDIVKYKQNTSISNNIKTIELYDSLMRKNGIIAVGDISNTNITKGIKKKSSIYYHTFVEAIGLGENYKEIFEKNIQLYNEFRQTGLSASIAPHAAYSVSEKLFLQIKEFSESNNSILSIHNQECEAENQMFIDKSGELLEVLENVGVNLTAWNPTGKNSLESILDFLPQSNNIIFVHNTYSKISDLEFVNRNVKSAFWCLCPLSNLYIENKLPDLNLFVDCIDNVTLGTDSLASNTSLSILEEMKAIVNNSKEIEFDKLLRWATLNGAKALNIDNKFGSIEKGKSPGLNLITNFNFEKTNISDKSDIKVLV